jgi:hypothetical protein
MAKPLNGMHDMADKPTTVNDVVLIHNQIAHRPSIVCVKAGLPSLIFSARSNTPSKRYGVLTI